MAAEAAHLLNPPAAAPAAEVDTDTPDGAEKPKAKTFTQDEVNKLQAQHKKALQAKLAEAETKSAALEKRLAEIEAKVSQPETPTAADKTADGRLEAEIKRMNKILEEQKSKTAEVEERAIRAEARRVEALRNQALNEALVAAGCTDLKCGIKYFRDEILDKDEDGVPFGEADSPSWALKLPSGAYADLITGVNELLPKYLRNPSGNVGGAGTVPGKSKDKNKIEDLEKKVKALYEKAQSGGGREPDMAAYISAKRQLQALKSQTK